MVSDISYGGGGGDIKWRPGSRGIGEASHIAHTVCFDWGYASHTPSNLLVKIGSIFYFIFGRRVRWWMLEKRKKGSDNPIFDAKNQASSAVLRKNRRVKRRLWGWRGKEGVGLRGEARWLFWSLVYSEGKKWVINVGAARLISFQGGPNKLFPSLTCTHWVHYINCM